MSLEPGASFDRYVIRARLGAGGMGEVYRAHDARLQRDVALKILRASSFEATGSDGPQRILREARSAAALEHPNVVAVFDVGETTLPGEHDATAYIAMELIKGRSLRELVGDRSVPLSERVRWLTDAARALAAAHTSGLVHRDIKPENVMLRDDGVIKVLDFGLARRSTLVPTNTTSSTDAHVMSTFHTGRSSAAGTPYYMAPEQIRNERLDGRADQFAWGVLAYELLAGRLPWSTEGDMLPLVAEILSDDPAAPSSHNPDIPAPLEVIVLRALAKSRGDRFPSMENVVTALSAASGRITPVAYVETEAAVPAFPTGLGSKARPEGRHRSEPSRTSRWASVPWYVAAGATLVTLGVLGVVRPGREGAGVTSTPAPTLRECTTNRECTTKLGEPGVCRGAGACAALASVDCHVLGDADDVTDDQTVWIGTMFPLTVDPETGGADDTKAVDLARRDFAQTMGAVLTSGASRRTHPIGVLACDDGVDAARAAHHLVDDVGVPAVIGFRSSRELMDLAESLFLPKDVVAITAVNTNPLIATLPHPAGGPRRVWRTTYDGAETALPLAAFVSDVLEPRVRGGRDGATGPIRVATVRFSAAQLALSELLFKALRFNGKAAVDNGPDYRELFVDEGPETTAFGKALDDLVAFAPDILVFEGMPDARAKLLEPLESRWPASRRSRPTYLKIEPLTDDELAFVGKNAERRRRMFGVTTASNTPTNARLVMHYNQTFHENLPRTLSPNTAYDAFYMLGYAVYALGDQPVTGSSLARAFSRLLPPGKPIEVGPSSIFEGFNALRAGQNIDLLGSSGSLDFDTVTGQAPTDDVILCFGVDREGNASESIESGVVYDATAKKLVGKLRCP